MDSNMPTGPGIEIIKDPQVVQEARETFRRHREEEIRERLEHPEQIPLHDTELLANLRAHSDIAIPALRTLLTTTQSDLATAITIREIRSGGCPEVLDLSRDLSDTQLASAAVLALLDDVVGVWAIVQVLREGSTKQRAAALDVFSLNSGKEAIPFMQSAEYREALTILFDDPNDDLWCAAIRMAEAIRLPNLKEAVAKRWKDRPALLPDSLLHLATKHAPSSELVALVQDRLSSGANPHWYLMDLGNMIAAGEPAVRQEAVDVLAAYVEHHRQHRDLDRAVEILAPIATQEHLPLFEELIKHSNPSVANQALATIARIKGKTSFNLLMQSLDDHRLRSKAVRLIGQLGHSSQDPRLVSALSALIESVTSTGVLQGSSLSLFGIGDALLGIGGPVAEEAARKLLSCTGGLDRWALGCRINGWDTPSIAGRLEELGVLPLLPLGQEDSTAAEYEDEDERHLAWEMICLLTQRGVFSGFDVESDRSPDHHDELLMELSRLTEGQFTPEACLQLQDDPSDDRDCRTTHKVQFIFRERLYRFEVTDGGDYWDFHAVLSAANAALADHQLAKRMNYVSMGDLGILLAPPEAVARARDEGLLPRDEMPQSLG